jgi:L-rhamnose mutarotase
MRTLFQMIARLIMATTKMTPKKVAPATKAKPKTTQKAKPMRRVAFMLKVKENMLAEYKRRHAEVWPDMLQALRETGWHRYSIYMTTNGTLFGYLETPDFAKAKAGMAKREVNARWQADMAPFFEGIGGKKADESFVLLEEVFHLD